MADYPSTIPTLVDPVGTDKTNSTTVPHAELHAQVNDEIKAIATELGTNAKGVAVDVKTRISAIETDVTAAQASITALELIDHTQNTDTKLDNGGANEVTAAQAKAAYTHVSSTVDHVPSQTGNNGKYLTTNGTASSWGAIVTIPSGIIAMWSGTVASIPSGWYLCDGNNSTPDLRDKFIVGAKQDDSGTAKTNLTGSLTASGGSTTIAEGNLPTHAHSVGGSSGANGAHTHKVVINATGGSGANCSAVSVTDKTSGFAATYSNYFATDDPSTHTHTLPANTGNIGSGTAYTQPYYALAFIMKA